MSKKNNLNPDYYKTAGRGRQGDGIEQTAQRQQFNEEEARLAREEREGRAGGPAEREGQEQAKRPQEEQRSDAVRGQSRRPPQKQKKTGKTKQPQRA